MTTAEVIDRLDCLNRTETAMNQRHAFLAAELDLKAQAAVKRIAR